MKALFRHPADRAYFNCAYLGLLPLAAIEQAAVGLGARSEPWRASGSVELAERVRAAFARLIGADVATVALVPSTSYGMAEASRAIPLGPGRNVVVLDNEHPSQILPLGNRCRETGATLVVARAASAADLTAAIVEAIDDATAAVCVPQVTWIDGQELRLAEIAVTARRHGAMLMIDATQSAGARTLDVTALDPDYLMVSAYKWLWGPMGAGFLYVAPRHHDRVPLEAGITHHAPPGDRWFGAACRLVYDQPFRQGARRFDAAGSQNPILLAPLAASLDLLNDLTVAAIERRCLANNRRIVQSFTDLFPTGVDDVSHIVSLPVIDQEEALRLLDRHAIVASLRGGVVRLAGNVWTDEADIERLFNFLEAARPIVAKTAD